MAKSATVVRGEKQSTQPEKAGKAAGKVSTAVVRDGGSKVAGENPVTGFFTGAVDFLKDVRGEMRKVVTPSKEEVRNTTTVVIVTVFAFAAFFYVVDGVLGRTVQTLLHWLGGTQ